MRRDWIYRRGDLYLANLNPFQGSEQGGTRPVVVLQNNDGNYYCPTLIVAPLTSMMKKTNLPVHYRLAEAKGMKEPSIVLLEQIKTIDKCRICAYLGKVSKQQMEEIEEALKISLGIWIPDSVEAP